VGLITYSKVPEVKVDIGNYVGLDDLTEVVFINYTSFSGLSLFK
jgi:hypothetical protein